MIAVRCRIIQRAIYSRRAKTCVSGMLIFMVLSFGLVVRARSESDNESLVLQFKPPDGSGLIERSDRQTVRSSVDGTNVYGVDHDVMVTEWVFHPGSSGYIASQVARGMEGEVNHKPFENPFKKLIIGRTNTYFLSPIGDLLGLEGGEQLVSEMKLLSPTNLHSQIDKEFNPKTHFDFEKRTWRFNVGRLANRTVKAGDSWREDWPINEQNKHFLLTKVHEIKEVGSKRMVKFVTMESSNVQNIEVLNLDSVGTPEATAKFLTIDKADAFERMVQVRIVDAATMLPSMDQRITVWFRPTPDAKGWVKREVLAYDFKVK